MCFTEAALRVISVNQFDVFKGLWFTPSSDSVIILSHNDPYSEKNKKIGLENLINVQFLPPGNELGTRNRVIAPRLSLPGII